MIMDYEYYGISKDDFDHMLRSREDYILDYWRGGRHFSKHRLKNPGFASRIFDKNLYANLLNSFYQSSDMMEQSQGVFYGYGHNNFTNIHLENMYILKLDFKSCYRNISIELFLDILEAHQARLVNPIPIDLIKIVYFPNGYLQAGLSASNIICDLVLKYNFDKRINKMIWKDGRMLAAYSRYYDDIYVSSDDISLLKEVRMCVKDVAKKLGLPLNYKKCYLRVLNGSKILGSTIVAGEVRIARMHKNNLRAAIHQLKKISDEDRSYESELRSVVSKLANICQHEREPNQKYVNAYRLYRDELSRLTEVEY